jgi:biopolymer transport protein ExbD
VNRRGGRRRNLEAAELNITAFLNLMVILVPFLLITAVFSRVAVLELNMPGPSAATDEAAEESFNLEVTIRVASIEVGDRRTGVLRSFEARAGAHDYAAIGEFLGELKGRFPDQTEATLLLEPDVSYDVLVQVMDTVRVAVVEREEEGKVQAELFPDISIGDAPPTVREGSS